MLLFQTYWVCWLSNQRYQGIQFQATTLDYRTKHLLKDNMDNLWVQLNLVFVCILIYYHPLVKKSNLHSHLHISYSWTSCFHPRTLVTISNWKSLQNCDVSRNRWIFEGIHVLKIPENYLRTCEKSNCKLTRKLFLTFSFMHFAFSQNTRDYFFGRGFEKKCASTISFRKYRRKLVTYMFICDSSK